MIQCVVTNTGAAAVLPMSTDWSRRKVKLPLRPDPDRHWTFHRKKEYDDLKKT